MNTEGIPWHETEEGKQMYLDWLKNSLIPRANKKVTNKIEATDDGEIQVVVEFSYSELPVKTRQAIYKKYGTPYNNSDFIELCVRFEVKDIIIQESLKIKENRENGSAFYFDDDTINNLIEQAIISDFITKSKCAKLYALECFEQANNITFLEQENGRTLITPEFDSTTQHIVKDNVKKKKSIIKKILDKFKENNYD